MLLLKFTKGFFKWRSYIHYNNKRYGNKLFDNVHDAILYRWDLENMIKTEFSQ